jgi:hypothetical protein
MHGKGDCLRDGDIMSRKARNSVCVTYRKNSPFPILEAYEVLEAPETSSDGGLGTPPTRKPKPSAGSEL